MADSDEQMADANLQLGSTTSGFNILLRQATRYIESDMLLRVYLGSLHSSLLQGKRSLWDGDGEAFIDVVHTAVSKSQPPSELWQALHPDGILISPQKVASYKDMRSANPSSEVEGFLGLLSELRYMTRYRRCLNSVM